MADEISALTDANRRLESQLAHLCRLAETYTMEHAHRKSKRSAIAARASAAETSLRELCQLICRLFPQAATPGEPPSPEQARRIVLSISQVT
jgi:hypothetical protein